MAADTRPLDGSWAEQETLPEAHSPTSRCVHPLPDTPVSIDHPPNPATSQGLPTREPDALDAASSTVAHGSADTRVYPLMPLIAIPSMNVRWAKKNTMTTGRMTTVLAAIRYGQASFSTNCPRKRCRPSETGNCSG